jgi:hypothetical protein
MKYESEFSTPSNNGEACTLKVSSLGGGEALFSFLVSCGEGLAGDPTDCRRFLCIFESISIFSSRSSRRSFRSRSSASSCRTRSSSDSVYPRGNARRLSLSLVLHSKPTVAHCEHVGLMPSHRIFLLRQRSQAWAIRLCELVPTLMTFIGRIPGILAVCYICPCTWNGR